MANPQPPKPQETGLEKVGKFFLSCLYMGLIVFLLNAYFTFTPIQHDFIKREWVEVRHPNGVIERNEKWTLKLSGVVIK
ncbi:MAG: hypothetical protein IPO06_29635 [Leptospiraceae bacterium]|nr:hypothetical protein [Leptospiraceae bacterium]MBP6738369.1 hypothetical protein [Leptospiraceae bacterium]